jgi:hypothetical protein
MDHTENTVSSVAVYGLLPSNGLCLVVFSWSLPSNGSTCHIFPSFRLLVLNSPQVYCYFFFSKGCACDICVWPHLPFLWLGRCGDYCPTTPTAPSLRLLVASGSLIRCEPVQVYHHHHFFLFLGLCFGHLCFCFGGGWPLTMSSHSPCTVKDPTIHFFNLLLYILPEDPARCPLLPQT